MNKRNFFLSAVLLVLVGILIGGILTLWQQGKFVSTHSLVHFTQIKRSGKPLFSDSSLQKIGPRFLFKSVAARVKPSIVYITSVVSLNKYHDLNHPKHNDDHHFFYHFHAPKARTVGSGVIVSPNGYIVTNDHVIRGAVHGKILVELNNKEDFHARITGADPTTDLAVLKIDAHHLRPITIGNSNKVEVGEWVLAFGNPFRLRETVTAGIVSAVNRQVEIAGEIHSKLHINNYIQTDAAINKGNSGGALVNISGQLIGINTAIAIQNGSYQGYGFAIPSNLVSKVIHDLIQYGKVHRALLGVQIMGLKYKQALKLGLHSVKGVEVIRVSKNGAAKRSGIKPKDVILAVNNKPVNAANELQAVIALHHPGDVVQLKIWRDDKVIEPTVKLGGVEAFKKAKKEQKKH